MIDIGRYRGRITDYGVIEPGPGGEHRQVFIEFEIVGRCDPTSGKPTGCPGGRRTYYKAITPKTIEWLVADLTAIGYDRESFRGLDPEAPEAVNLFGREIDVVCEHEEYQGVDRERWSIGRTWTRRKVGVEALKEIDALYADRLRRAVGDRADSKSPSLGACGENIA